MTGPKRLRSLKREVRSVNDDVEMEGLPRPLAAARAIDPFIVMDVMRDAREAGCDIFFVGQYLQPTREHLSVVRYVEPDEFKWYEEQGGELGFRVTVSGPLVRSSFFSEAQDAFVRGAGEGERT